MDLMTLNKAAQRYLELTEIIYQAMKSDQFEVAEQAIFDRDEVLRDLLDTTSGSTKLLKFEGLEQIQKSVSDFEVLIKKEFDRFESELKQAAQENRKQLQNLKSGSKIVKQYSSYSNDFSGGNFDNRK